MRALLFIAVCIALSGCGVPSYSLKGPAPVPIQVVGNDGLGFVAIKKLDAACTPEAKFDKGVSGFLCARRVGC